VVLCQNQGAQLGVGKLGFAGSRIFPEISQKMIFQFGMVPAIPQKTVFQLVSAVRQPAIFLMVKIMKRNYETKTMYNQKNE
jgi:hypothetical protein